MMAVIVLSLLDFPIYYLLYNSVCERKKLYL